MAGLESDIAKANDYLARLGLSLNDMVGKTCLEIGSGDCFLGYVCQAAGINLISLDKEPGGYPGSHSYAGEVPFVKADAARLPFAELVFDLVLSSWSPPTVCVFAIREIKACCDEAMRVLKDSGEFRFGPDLLAGKYYQPNRVPRQVKDWSNKKMSEKAAVSVWEKSRLILRSLLPDIVFSHAEMVDNHDAENTFCVVQKRGALNQPSAAAGKARS
jgi:hypothetical protein